MCHHHHIVLMLIINKALLLQTMELSFCPSPPTRPHDSVRIYSKICKFFKSVPKQFEMY